MVIIALSPSLREKNSNIELSYLIMFFVIFHDILNNLNSHSIMIFQTFEMRSLCV